MKIIDVLNQDKINISCELFPPKQGAELQNALDIVKEIVPTLYTKILPSPICPV